MTQHAQRTKLETKCPEQRGGKRITSILVALFGKLNGDFSFREGHAASHGRRASYIDVVYYILRQILGSL